MPCDTRLKPRQTIKERAIEVRAAVAKLGQGLINGRIKPKIGPTGGIAFPELTENERDGVTDACIYRRLMAEGSVLAKQAIARAEALAGRTVNRQSLAHGHHSHDGGKTWHEGH